MRTHLTTLLAAGTLAAASLAAPAAMAADGFAPIIDEGPGGERYVSFGDSFVAGPGVLPTRLDSGACTRSSANYPSLLASSLGVKQFVDASCSGATTADLSAPQSIAGTTNPPQFNALSTDTTLVTFGTMGGNDIGLVQLATSCIGLGNCVPDAGTDPLAAKFDQLRADLGAAIDETRRRAPSAAIVMVGYGTYLPVDGCALRIPTLTATEANYMQGQINRLSDTIEAVANEKKVTFADMRTVPESLAHTACAPDSEQWIRPLTFLGDGVPFHPTGKGMEAWAAHLDPILRTAIAGRPGAPQPPRTPAQRLKTLRTQAAVTQLKVRCVGPHGPHRRVVFSVTKAPRSMTRSVVWAGSNRLSVDTRAPWVTTRKARAVRGHLKARSAKVRVVITVRDAQLTHHRTLRLAHRPPCLRRM